MFLIGYPADTRPQDGSPPWKKIDGEPVNVNNTCLNLPFAAVIWDCCFIYGFLLCRLKPCSSCRRTLRPFVVTMLITLTSLWWIIVWMKLLRNCKKPLTGLAVLHSGCLSPGFTKLIELANMFQPAFGMPPPFLKQKGLLQLLALCNCPKYVFSLRLLKGWSFPTI